MFKHKVLKSLKTLLKGQAQLMATVADLQTEVKAMSDKMDKVVQLITDLRNAGGATPTQLDDVLNAMKAVEAKEDAALTPPTP